MTATPSIYVVSAPSGTGKTTLNRRLIRENPGAQMSVSFTTRPKRPFEIEGVDYHFVTRQRFEEHTAQGEMLEYAEVFGNLYGTSLAEVKRIQGLGKSVLLEIDVQGWREAKLKLPGAIAIFILPPSVETLWKRLQGRGTEARLIQYRRLMTARDEIAAGALYDYFIVNDGLEAAYVELHDIIINKKSGKIGPAAGGVLYQKLLAEFRDADWLQKLSREIADNNKGDSSSAATQQRTPPK